MNNSLTFIIMLLVMMMTMFASMKELNNYKKDKKTPFECGFNQMSMKKTTFSTNFLLVSMMFLIFDMEMSFLIPSILSNKNKFMMMAMSLIFIVILSVILLKEWNQGSLEWNK